MNYRFVTDTATLCVFDPASLRHRLNDDADWWSIPEDEIEEVNSGNVAFFGLGRDGRYDVEVVDSFKTTNPINLKCPSGKIFIGAGEEVSSDGLEPEAVRGGGFLQMEPGFYELHAQFVGNSTIRIAFLRTSEFSVNSFTQPIRLDPRR